MSDYFHQLYEVGTSHDFEKNFQDHSTVLSDYIEVGPKVLSLVELLNFIKMPTTKFCDLNLFLECNFRKFPNALDYLSHPVGYRTKKNPRPDTWCSAKVLACHAAGPGSIPGRGNKDALISHKSITWSLGIDLAPSFGARLDKTRCVAPVKNKKQKTSFGLPLLLLLPCCYALLLGNSFGLPLVLPRPCCYAVLLCRSFGVPLLLTDRILAKPREEENS